MKTTGFREVHQRYEVLKETIEGESEVILPHHGKPFARALLIAAASQQVLRAQRGEELAASRATLPALQTPSEVLIREDRDAR